MKYDLASPCKECPFRNDIRPYISTERVIEIIEAGPFSCHKTTTCRGVSNDDPDAQHCAGALILLEKMEKPHQLMRIAERFGVYDRHKLNMDSPVYDSFTEVISAHRDEEKKYE